MSLPMRLKRLERQVSACCLKCGEPLQCVECERRVARTEAERFGINYDRLVLLLVDCMDEQAAKVMQ